MPRYYQPYANASTSARTQSSTRTTPTQQQQQQYALDGKDWYLKDGVSWQQNFESWGGLGTSGASQHGGIPAVVGGGGGGGGEAGDMYMFKGLLPDGDLDMGDGWDFDSSMTNLDMIPGLD